ncbi:YrzI family small protein [Fictibacillus enclensis]|uniref:Probable sporulation protein (Bac_small_yrzI) n=1 Tax=Fictibacillus solisalsi TaxID=459525 RepID=A0A1G9WN56_9BACL|nr:MULTISPECIES: YrzI family small protein [Fictibacillus]MDM5199883.1 YrzI family small protein [Fictibacillus enclensis]MDM5339194.1 YrzI family small protein [Fictibacillus enclensis]WHY70654.1 YrzI family small protein [Fictibacillus enclensis]SCC21868.1 Probable sporulation protein (Bac_small_yrzI) [Fictibacillus enclensis]SDM85930.1 Probable sporulation protein (Bac_small_yrzI) [Fictibacillus solisalsi]
MLTLNLFFATLTISLRKNERTYKDYVHQQNVNELFEAAHTKAGEANYLR